MEVFNNKVEICALEPRGFPFPAVLFVVLSCSLFYFFTQQNSFDYSQIKANVLLHVIKCLKIKVICEGGPFYNPRVMESIYMLHSFIRCVEKSPTM